LVFKKRLQHTCHVMCSVLKLVLGWMQNTRYNCERAEKTVATKDATSGLLTIFMSSGLQLHCYLWCVLLSCMTTEVVTTAQGLFDIILYCVYVCMYVCIYVCIMSVLCVCVYARTYVCKYVHTFVRNMCMCVCIRMYFINMHVCTYVATTYMCRYVCRYYAWKYVCTCVSNMYVCMYVRKSVLNVSIIFF